MSAMKKLILTTGDSAAGALRKAGLADCVIAFGQRFVRGKLWSPAKLETFLSSRPGPVDDPEAYWLAPLSGKAIDDARARVRAGWGWWNSAGNSTRSNCGSILNPMAN